MEHQIPYFLLECSEKEKQEQGVLLCTSVWKHEQKGRRVLVAFQEISVPEYANTPSLLWCLHLIQMYTNT